MGAFGGEFYLFNLVILSLLLHILTRLTYFHQNIEEKKDEDSLDENGSYKNNSILSEEEVKEEDEELQISDNFSVLSASSSAHSPHYSNTTSLGPQNEGSTSDATPNPPPSTVNRITNGVRKYFTNTPARADPPAGGNAVSDDDGYDLPASSKKMPSSNTNKSSSKRDSSSRKGPPSSSIKIRRSSTTTKLPRKDLFDTFEESNEGHRGIQKKVTRKKKKKQEPTSATRRTRSSSVGNPATKTRVTRSSKQKL